MDNGCELKPFFIIHGIKLGKTLIQFFARISLINGPIWKFKNVDLCECVPKRLTCQCPQASLNSYTPARIMPAMLVTKKTWDSHELRDCDPGGGGGGHTGQNQFYHACPGGFTMDPYILI